MLFISATINSQTTFTATNVRVTDTLRAMNVMYAQTVRANDTLRCMSGVVAEKDLRVDGTLNLTGDINAPITSTANLGEVIAKGNIRTEGSFLLNTPTPGQAPLGLKVFNSTNSINTGPIIKIGNPENSPDPPLPCSLPNNNPWMFMQGGYIAKTTNLPVNASLSMYCAPWNGSSFIEAEGTNEAGINKTALLLNYFCGNDIGLCLNTGLANGGGKVLVGNFLSATEHVEIGNPQYGITKAGNVALDMNVHAGKAIKINTYNQGITAFELVNTGLNPVGTYFKILGNGKTFIGAQKVVANNPHNNAILQVSGKIACKELVVLDPIKWADFVFDKSYKLMPLNDVEEFYQKNKHLPNVPSEKEIKETGINTAEMDATLLQKIEELTLYMVEQNKRIEKLEKENLILKNK